MIWHYDTTAGYAAGDKAAEDGHKRARAKEWLELELKLNSTKVRIVAK